jgi:hypothetical protein
VNQSENRSENWRVIPRVLKCVVEWRSHVVDIAKHVMSNAKVYGMREREKERVGAGEDSNYAILPLSNGMTPTAFLHLPEESDNLPTETPISLFRLAPLYTC